jgi:signal transduction histidine kinase
MLGTLFAMIVAQFLVVLFTISQANDLYVLASDIQSIMIVFLFMIFVYLVIIFNYLPYRLSRAVRRVEDLIDEISNGNYQLDIDATSFENDQEFQDLVMSITRMLDIISRFDAVKADKIYEHHQRINQLINLLPQMVMIATVNGDIVYINDAFRKNFPNIDETNNLNEVILKDDFNAKVFDIIAESLRYGNNLYDERVEPEGSSQTALIKGSIIRNRKGIASGGVFTVELIGSKE